MRGKVGLILVKIIFNYFNFCSDSTAYKFGPTQEVVRDGGQLRAWIPIPTENVNATGA